MAEEIRHSNYPFTAVVKDTFGRTRIKRIAEAATHEHEARRSVLQRFLGQGLQVIKLQIDYAGTAADTDLVTA